MGVACSANLDAFRVCQPARGEANAPPPSLAMDDGRVVVPRRRLVAGLLARQVPGIRFAGSPLHLGWAFRQSACAYVSGVAFHVFSAAVATRNIKGRECGKIESEFAGRVVSVLVENGNPVEFGQPLFVVEE